MFIWLLQWFLPDESAPERESHAQLDRNHTALNAVLSLDFDERSTVLQIHPFVEAQ